MTRFGPIIRRVFVAVLAAVLLAGTAEVVLRHFPRFMPPEKQILEFNLHSPFRATSPDPDLGFVARPDDRRVVTTVDYTTSYRTDSRGFPNAEPWPQPAELLFLGDSLAFGYGLEPEASYPTLIARALSRSEVNLALAASGPERQDAVFRKFGAALHPRCVLSVVYAASDFDNDRSFLTWNATGKPGLYDLFRLRPATGQAEPIRARAEHLLNRSWLYADVTGPLLDWLSPVVHPPDRYRFPDGSEILLDRNGLNLAVTPAELSDPRIDAMLVSLRKLRTDVSDAGGVLIAVMMPSKEELFGASAAAVEVNAASQLRNRIAADGFPLLDLYPVLRDGGRLHSPYFAVDMHLNSFGNQLVTDAAVRWLRVHAPC